MLAFKQISLFYFTHLQVQFFLRTGSSTKRIRKSNYVDVLTHSTVREGTFQKDLPDFIVHFIRHFSVDSAMRKDL